MKIGAWAILFLLPLTAQEHAELTQVQAVYMLRMRSGFDQHLANHVAQAALFRVVTDPSKADALFTDRLGRAFEDQLKELYPPPAPEPKEPEPQDEETVPSIRPSEKPRSTAMSNTSGTLFLVDRRSRHVIWSTFARPKSYDAKDLDSTAASVVKRLQETLRPPAK